MSGEFGHTPTNETGFRLQRAILFDRWIDESPFKEMLQSSEGRSGLVRSFTHDFFVKFVGQVNSVLTDQPNSADLFVESVNGFYEEGSSRSLDVAPAPEDKIPLLGTVLKTAKYFDDPEEQAVVLGYGINAVHPFSDGNGRTSRAMYLLFSRDYHYGHLDVVDTLGENGDFTHVLDANIFTPAIYMLMNDSFDTHYIDENGLATIPKYQPGIVEKEFASGAWIDDGIDTPNREFNSKLTGELATVFFDERLGPILSYILIEKANLKTAQDLTRQVAEGRHMLAVDKFLKYANEDEIQLAYKTFRLIKSRYIDILMDQFMDSKTGNSMLMLVPNRLDLGPMTPLDMAKMQARKPT